jgi:hypothetical protein
MNRTALNRPLLTPTRATDRRATVGRLGLLALLLTTAGGGAPLHAQESCDALVARAENEFDTARRIELLGAALNPSACPPRGAWAVGVQLLAQTLLEDHQDSLAATWVRWAIRLAPDLQPDTVQFLPRVVEAFRSAREFVARTRSPADSATTTTWVWPAQTTDAREGRLQVATTATAPAQVVVEGVGLIASGSAAIRSGSYAVRVSAPGYDSARATREVLPGVTTAIDFHLRSALAQVAPKAQPVRPQSAAVPQKKKGFPVVWAVLGAGGVAAVVAILAGKGGGNPQPTTGGIIITLPSNP